jgi:GGDEF domain-containing protein
MLKINKILSFFYILLIFLLYTLNFKVLANDHTPHQEKLISQIEQLFKKNYETLNYDNVTELSYKIINQRSHYPSEIVAKTYLLLAYVTNNKGEVETSLQFSNDGLAIANQNKETRLNLQINLAKILLAKKNYQQLLATAQKIINTPENNKNKSYFLIALSYRSVAFSMLKQHTKALIDIQQIEKNIQKMPIYSEHISLLIMLANAYYYLDDYQNSLTVQLKVLNLQLNLNRLNNIDRTYFYLAKTYYRLNRFNDAYTAYWEAKNHAIKKEAPIYVAYASQGLALTLLRQKQYVAAEIKALESKELFYKYNLSTPYLESIIILTEIYNAIKKDDLKSTLLLKAEMLLGNTKLTADYIIVYQYLADLYFVKSDLNKAYYWQKKYSQNSLEDIQFTNTKNELNNYSLNKRLIEYNKNENSTTNTKTKNLAINITKQSDLISSISDDFSNQQLIILTLTVTVLALLSFIIILLVKKRQKRLLFEYKTLESPSYVCAKSMQTKQLYQTSFNMAKKYNYPLSLGYISITNWQELTFKFNHKIVSEVNRGITHLINEKLNEFENLGLINDGEYLLFFPHQNKENVIETMEKLISALKLIFFANLDEFSIIIAYSIESPDFQDIDPYIFLSQLRNSIKLA